MTGVIKYQFVLRTWFSIKRLISEANVSPAADAVVFSTNTCKLPKQCINKSALSFNEQKSTATT
jgi:hypothetical protein